jgi:alkylation response protein AidB-like acyl-CoA dehydrogenase
MGRLNDPEKTMLAEQEQDELRRLLRGYLEDRSPELAVRTAMETEQGFVQELWDGLGASGLDVCGLAVPTKWGGASHTFAEVAIVLEELGRVLACATYLSSALLGQTLLQLVASDGDTEPADRWLPRLASGETRAAVAVAEADGRWSADAVATTAEADGDRWRLTGTKEFVVDGHTAEVLLVVARTGASLSLFEVLGDAPGLARRSVPTIDLTRKQARLEFADTPARLIGEAGRGWQLIEDLIPIAAAGLAAESLGGMRRTLEMAVAYAKTRSQFGRPIGSFQAIKHKCADMLLAVESSDSLVRDAVRRIVDQDPEAPATAALAYAYCHDGYLDCASENVQVHGGIGFTWEHGAQLYYKRALTSRLLLGDPTTHRARAAQLIGL